MARSSWKTLGSTTRRAAMIAVTAMAIGVAPVSVAAQSGSPLSQIVRQLEDQGFTIQSVRRTWLGRTRIVARSRTYEREVVFVPSTGEILRDYWEELGGDSGSRRRAGGGKSSGGGNSGSGGSGGGNNGPGGGGDEDDDEDDNSGPGGGDDDDEDNSESGGGDDDDDDDDNSESGGSDDDDDDDDDEDDED